MRIEHFIAGIFDANNYLLFDEESKEAVLIDCSEAKQEILDKIKELGAKVKYILLTHGHFDHVMGVNEMKELLSCEVLIHEKDVEWLARINNALTMFNMPPVETPKHDKTFVNNDKIQIGKHEITILHTPGHTQGSVCFKVNNDLFSGDTLFKNAVGRTDLYGGDWLMIQNSIKDVLFNLPDETIVYPGHGDMTTIACEKKFNREI